MTMAEAHILKIDSLPVVDRGNGIQTTPLVTKEIGSKQITTGLTRFPAGAKVPLHSHNCDEQVTILEGEAEAEVDGKRHRLRPFDTTLVPASFHKRRHGASYDPLDLYQRRCDANLHGDRRDGRTSF
jgi:putative monooxygenase